mmetsp:Transcript_4488/g.8364  ORF Transcript_4488/g.8364 Transcript_4488/m.8364 type:complete len:319 (+) Transcript_4488:761-1717(+)
MLLVVARSKAACSSQNGFVGSIDGGQSPADSHAHGFEGAAAGTRRKLVSKFDALHGFDVTRTTSTSTGTSTTSAKFVRQQVVRQVPRHAIVPAERQNPGPALHRRVLVLRLHFLDKRRLSGNVRVVGAVSGAEFHHRFAVRAKGAGGGGDGSGVPDQARQRGGIGGVAHHHVVFQKAVRNEFGQVQFVGEFLQDRYELGSGPAGNRPLHGAVGVRVGVGVRVVRLGQVADGQSPRKSRGSQEDHVVFSVRAWNQVGRRSVCVCICFCSWIDVDVDFRRWWFITSSSTASACASTQNRTAELIDNRQGQHQHRPNRDHH